MAKLMPRIDHTGNTRTHEEVDAQEALSEGLILDKTAGVGFKIDPASPDYGWRDLRGMISRDTGAAAPTFATYIGGVKQWQFPANKESMIEYHIPHDYVLGTDLYIHVHWSQTTVDTGDGGSPGTGRFDFEVLYAKGHDQAAFPGTTTTLYVEQVASSTVRQHMVAEVQLSDPSPTANQLDTDDIEPDGILLVLVKRNGSDTLDQDPFIHEVDLHYQSTGMATKNKSPDFYT